MTDSSVNVLAFAGSLRRQSLNRRALAIAAGMAPPGMTVEVVELDGLPLYEEELYQSGTCARANEFRAKVSAADALLMAVPEYNFSVSGVLKNALDWASRPPKPPLVGKPYAMLGASSGILGTARAQYHLRQICGGLDMKAVNRPEVFIGQAQNKFDADGNLTDQAAVKLIGDLMVALRDWTLKLRG